jgi:hypothetical protein
MSENELEISKSGAQNDGALATIEPQPTRAIAVVSPELAKRLAQATGKVKALVRDGVNEFHHYRYPTIAQVRERANDALAEAGLSIVPSIARVGRSDRVSDKGKTISLTTVELDILVTSEDGCITARWVGESEDVGDKGVQKAVSAAVKAFLSNLLLIPVTEDENDKQARRRKSRKLGAQLPMQDLGAAVVTGVDKGKPAPKPAQPWTRNAQIVERFRIWTQDELGLSGSDIRSALLVTDLRDYGGTMAEAKLAIEAYINAQQTHADVQPATDQPGGER